MPMRDSMPCRRSIVPSDVFCGRRPVCAAAMLGATTFADAAAPDGGTTTRYVSARITFAGPSAEVGAVRPSGLSPDVAFADALPAAQPTPGRSLQACRMRRVHDVAFSNAKARICRGRTGSGLEDNRRRHQGTWTATLNRGSPYYYYGIAATGKTVVASGFNDNNSEAILSESTDGGKSWSLADIILQHQCLGRAAYGFPAQDGAGTCDERRGACQSECRMVDGHAE